jgi:CheY-like chemotaxis protein
VVVQDLKQAQELVLQLMPQAVVIDTACAELISTAVDTLADQWGLAGIPFLVCPLPGEEPLRKRLAVNGYLIKPVSRENLWDTLRRFGEGIDRILAIDDDRDFVRMLRRMLDNPVRRYRVIGAYSGREGLEMFQYKQFDLVLLDLMLPDINGVQIIERIRSSPRGRDLPIVIVSAQDEMDHLEALKGTVSISKADGLMPGEVVQLIQEVLETTTCRRSSPGGDNGGLARTRMAE